MIAQCISSCRIDNTQWRKPRINLAFTLVELLVVISIIGILMGLLLPAVLAVRESSRRLSCSNQMKQLTLSLHNFESAKKQLPSGVSLSSEPKRRTWLFDLLPYLEQEAVYRQGIQEFASQPDPLMHITFPTLIAALQCPSDPASGRQTRSPDPYGPSMIATTNYLGVNGLRGHDKSGVFFADSNTRFRDITDGLANTLLFGERPPSLDFRYGWWYSGYGFDGVGTADFVLGLEEQLSNPLTAYHLTECSPSPYTFQAGRRAQCDCLHFWSYHSGGGHFAYCDGSVRFISYSQSDILSLQATKDRGESVNTVD